MNLVFLFILCTEWFNNLNPAPVLFNNHKQYQIQSCYTTVIVIKNQLLNKPINRIPINVFPCFQQKKQVVTDEENESLSWNTLVFTKGKNTVFVAESNWQDQEKISRITILSPNVPSASGIKVGMCFEEIRHAVSNKIPNEPDGFLSLVDQKNPAIFYFLDISKYPKLTQGVDNLGEIPKQVKVEMMVIMQR